ncbi:MAG: class I SAM-dependent methyltransferase [Candidatus Heimdallarchaeaceae archaeon]
MNHHSSGVRTSYKLAETVLKELRKQKAIDLTLEFIREDEWLIIPVTLSEEQTLLLLEEIEGDFEVKSFTFTQKEELPKNLFDAVKEDIPLDLHNYIPKAYDLIGDIVVVDITEEILEYKAKIGNALLSLFPSISSVYRKASAVTGETRVRELELLAGEEKCETVHQEHGIKIFTNVCKAYFSPRLGDEHKRLSDKVKNNEIVVDLFTGVGSFPLHIARSKEATVFAVDINKIALSCLEKSMDLNKLKGTIAIVYGDCRHVINSLLKADKIIMNLPGKAQEYLDVVCQIIKPGGIIYFYQFVPDDKPEEKMKQILEEKLKEQNFSIKEIISFQKIRESAPREIHACLEVSVIPDSA